MNFAVSGRSRSSMSGPTANTAEVIDRLAVIERGPLALHSEPLPGDEIRVRLTFRALVDQLLTSDLPFAVSPFRREVEEGPDRICQILLGPRLEELVRVRHDTDATHGVISRVVRIPRGDFG